MKSANCEYLWDNGEWDNARWAKYSALWDNAVWDLADWDWVWSSMFDYVIAQLEKKNVSVNLWYSSLMWKHGFVWYTNDMCIIFDKGLEQLEK